MNLEERVFVKQALSKYEVLVCGMKFQMFGTWFRLVDVELYEVEHCNPPKKRVVDLDLPF
jgi:hypothetical protein